MENKCTRTLRYLQDNNGTKYEVLTSVCGWNRSWVPESLDPCVATKGRVQK